MLPSPSPMPTATWSRHPPPAQKETKSAVGGESLHPRKGQVRPRQATQNSCSSGGSMGPAQIWQVDAIGCSEKKVASFHNDSVKKEILTQLSRPCILYCPRASQYLHT
ncbi:hypothetical protein PO909_016736 [Leuciscus waleckii]